MAENATVPRLVPDLALPPYSYVPRRGLPHPTTDPAGHSFGRQPDPPPPLTPEHWPACRPYLCGFDLFNAGYFWEAHETWEPLWHAQGRKGAVADVVKGLIKLAAAGVKHLEGTPNGTATHARRAADLFRGVARSLGDDPALFLGLRLRDLSDLADAIAAGGWPEAPVVLLPALWGDRSSRNARDGNPSGGSVERNR